MNNRLSLLYQRLIASNRWLRWVNTQTVLLLIVSTVFLFTLAWTAPLSVDPAQAPSRALAGDQHPETGDGSYNRLALADTGESFQGALQATPEGNAAAQPTATPFPAEFAFNSQQTIGITLAATVLVLIVVVGVLVYMPKKNE